MHPEIFDKARIDEAGWLAALDLGSNSFRLEIARARGGMAERVEVLRRVVRMGAALDEQLVLPESAIRQATECLEGFGDRLRSLPKIHVTALATQVFRDASNAADVLRRASLALGYPIRVISGEQEARLIYAGVASSLPHDHLQRLVIDIGGRSTEVVMGKNTEVNALVSLPMGCVSWSQRHFANGELTEQAFQSAAVSSAQLLDAASGAFEGQHWDSAYASSGTAGAVAAVLEAAGWPAGTIDAEGLNWLKHQFLRAQHIDKLQLTALKPERRPVLAGGLAVLLGLFAKFKPSQVRVSSAALRQGVFSTVLGLQSKAPRWQTLTVQRLQNRFHIDPFEAGRLRKLCQFLREAMELSGAASMAIPDAGHPSMSVLDAASQLALAGELVASEDAHKHAETLLAGVELHGFSSAQREQILALVSAQQGKLKRHEALLQDLSMAKNLLALRLAVMMRWEAVCNDPRNWSLRILSGRIELGIPAAWWTKHPYWAQRLEAELEHWQKVGWQSRIEKT